MCLEAWPNGSVPFVSWWIMMYRTKFVEGWQKALSKVGVDNDVLEGLSTDNEVWQVLAHLVTPEFNLVPSDCVLDMGTGHFSADS